MEFVKRNGISVLAIIAALVALFMSSKGGMHAMGYEDEQSSSTAPQTITFDLAAYSTNCRILVLDQNSGNAVGAPIEGAGTAGIAQPGHPFRVPANTTYRLFPQFLDQETNTWKPFELKPGGTPASSFFVGSYVDRGGTPHGITIIVTVM